jgi:FkbM family methyltransferase
MIGPDRLRAALHDARREQREYAKLALRSALYRRRVDLVSDPYPVRVTTVMRSLGLDTVLDVGANIGQFGSALRASGFRGTILSCEPLTRAFAQLARRTARDPAWTALHTAVGAEPGQLKIHVAGNSFSSSVLPMTSAHAEAAPGSEFVGAEMVDVTTVSALVSERRIDPARALLKIDTQGYEGPVLDGAGSLAGSFAAIALELSFVPLYAGQQLFDDLVERLRAAGYVLYGLDAGFADPRTGRMLQCDGLFVRGALI